MSTLRIHGFQRSLKQGLDLGVAADARRSLDREVPRPESLTDEDWLGVRTAFRLLYQTAEREGLTETLADVRSEMAEQLADAQYVQLEQILTPDPETTQGLLAKRERDSFLPNLVGSSRTLDLRVLGSGSEAGRLVVAPVGLLRLEFDEPVAGQDALSFQLSKSAVEGLLTDLEELRVLFQVAEGATAPQVDIAPWARAEDNVDG